MDRSRESREGMGAGGVARPGRRPARLVGAGAAAASRVSGWSGGALLCGALLLATATASAATLEEVVGRQLDWLKRTDNYLAEIRTAGLQTGTIGTVFVDNTTSPPQVAFEGELEFPSKIKRNLEIVGSADDAAASVGNRASAWRLDKAPFGKSFAFFERGIGVDEAIRRLRQANNEVGVIENPAGGLTGIRMLPNPDFLTKMDGMLDSILLGGTLPRGVETIIWFNREGRIERMVLAEGGRDSLITTLEYRGVNLPGARARKYRRTIDTRAKAQVYPSFLEMLLAIKQDDARSEQKGK